MKAVIISLILTTGFFITEAQDVNRRDVVDKRQAVQRARIAEGRADGDLTRRETRALRQQQRHIRRAERRAEADGVVTRKEQARLNRKQNRANRNIRRAKNNKIDNN